MGTTVTGTLSVERMTQLERAIAKAWHPRQRLVSPGLVYWVASAQE